MGKQNRRDPIAKARKNVAKSQTRYMKAVAKGERQIRNVRAAVDEKIARAKAEFELRASVLAEAEANAAKRKASDVTPERAADVVQKRSAQRGKKPSSPVEGAIAVETAELVANDSSGDTASANGADHASLTAKPDARGGAAGPSRRRRSSPAR